MLLRLRIVLEIVVFYMFKYNLFFICSHSYVHRLSDLVLFENWYLLIDMIIDWSIDMIIDWLIWLIDMINWYDIDNCFKTFQFGTHQSFINKYDISFNWLYRLIIGYIGYIPREMRDVMLTHEMKFYDFRSIKKDICHSYSFYIVKFLLLS